eukprot:2330790-Alexandrium_andersonii.AAC.1
MKPVHKYRCRDCGEIAPRDKIYINEEGPALPWQGVYLICRGCYNNHLLKYAQAMDIPEEEWEKRGLAPWSAA